MKYQFIQVDDGDLGSVLVNIDHISAIWVNARDIRVTVGDLTYTHRCASAADATNTLAELRMRLVTCELWRIPGTK